MGLTFRVRAAASLNFIVSWRSSDTALNAWQRCDEHARLAWLLMSFGVPAAPLSCGALLTVNPTSELLGALATAGIDQHQLAVVTPAAEAALLMRILASTLMSAGWTAVGAQSFIRIQNRAGEEMSADKVLVDVVDVTSHSDGDASASAASVSSSTVMVTLHAGVAAALMVRDADEPRAGELPQEVIVLPACLPAMLHAQTNAHGNSVRIVSHVDAYSRRLRGEHADDDVVVHQVPSEVVLRCVTKLTWSTKRFGGAVLLSAIQCLQDGLQAQLPSVERIVSALRVLHTGALCCWAASAADVAGSASAAQLLDVQPAPQPHGKHTERAASSAQEGPIPTEPSFTTAAALRSTLRESPRTGLESVREAPFAPPSDDDASTAFLRDMHESQQRVQQFQERFSSLQDATSTAAMQRRVQLNDIMPWVEVVTRVTPLPVASVYHTAATQLRGLIVPAPAAVVRKELQTVTARDHLLPRTPSAAGIKRRYEDSSEASRPGAGGGMLFDPPPTPTKVPRQVTTDPASSSRYDIGASEQCVDSTI